MTVLSIPLTSLDAFRFVSFRDTAEALAELGISTRQQVSDRLGIHIDYVPDMHEMVGPLRIEVACAGVVAEHQYRPWIRSGRCRDNADRISVMGCVHEHIITAPLCSTHLVASLRVDTMWCGLCRARGADVPMREITLGRQEQVDSFLMDLLMAGVTTTDVGERARIHEFVSANLDMIVAPHLREPLEEA